MNLILVNVLYGLFAAVLGYFVGSIPTGVLVGKLFFHEDPRDKGSHNSGGTNVARTFGKKFGVLVIALDMIKALIPVFIIWAIGEFSPLNQYLAWSATWGNAQVGGNKMFYWIAGLFSAIGHCWPIYIHFKGGKAVACFMGLNCLTSWLQFVCSGLSYLYIAHKSKYISLTSIIVSGIGMIVAWIVFIIQVSVPSQAFNTNVFLWNFGFGPFLEYGFEYAIMDTAITVLLIARHKSNIERLKKHTETKNPFSKVSK